MTLVHHGVAEATVQALVTSHVGFVLLASIIISDSCAIREIAQDLGLSFSTRTTII